MKPLVLYILLISLLFCTIATAQSSYFDIKESRKFPDVNRDTEILAVHTTDQNETIIVREQKRKLIFEGFDGDAQRTFNKFTGIEKKEYFVGELFHGEELKVFTVFSPTKRDRTIHCYYLNVKDKTLKKETLFSTTVEKRQGLFSGKNKRQTNLAISPNGEFFVIATDNIKKHANSYIVRVFNAKTLSLVYEKSYYENAEKFYRSSDMAIDNEANVYTLGKEYISGRAEKRDNAANYTFVLKKISETDAVVQKINPENEQHIGSLRIVNKGSAFHLIGFFSGKNSGRIKGISNYGVNPENLEVLGLRNMDLPSEVYEDLYGAEKATKKKDKELDNFYLDHILEDEEGNTYMLAERFYITQNYVSNGTVGGGYFVTTYHYNEILILKFDVEGEMDWGRSIFKRSGFPSYNAFVKDNRLHVLLNSGKKLKKKKDGRVKASKAFLESTSLYDFVYDSEGKVQREKLQDNKGKTTYIPYLGNYKNGKFIMFNRSSNERQIMILESKE